MRTEHLGYHYSQFTFSHILADKAAKNGDKVFLHFLPDGRTFTYRQIHDLSNSVGNGLLSLGIGKGSHVAMLMENSPEQVLAYFALAKIGAVVVPINTAARGEFLSYYIRQSDCSALIADRALLPHFADLKDQGAISQVIVADLASDATPPEINLPSMAFGRLLESSTKDPDVDVSYRDVCAIMYTSGTTGPSKGNLFTHIHTLTFGTCQAEPFQYNADDIYHTCMPLFHVGAYSGALLTMLLVDGGVALTTRLSASRFWQEIRQSNATRAMLLSVTGFIWNQPPGEQDRAHRLRMAISTPVPDYAEDFERRFGVRLVQGYGLSDFGMGFTQAIDGPFEKRRSLGLPLMDVEARIVDEDDIDLPPGETGEIVLRKDGLPFAMTQGYYKMPEATAHSRQNLWFHTGDRGWKDADGYFYFADRKKDMIRRRGENISAFEVEKAILSHHGVADAAAYPVSSDNGDEDVGVTINLKIGCTLTEVEVIEHCSANMPYYMVPRYIEFRDELPRTMTQKIQKHILRGDAEAKKHLLWDREAEGIKLKR